MKPQKLLVLILVLCVLAGAGIFKKFRTEKPTVNKAGAVSERLLEGFMDGSVSKIQLKRGTDENIVVVKGADGSWKMESHYGTRARKENVDSLLNQLAAAKGEVRGEGASVLEDFSLTEEKAVQIRLAGADGQEIAAVRVSPLRPSGTRNFVMREGTAKVLATDTDFLSTLSIFSREDKLSYRIFADLRPAGLDSTKVQSMEWTPPGQKTMSFTRNEDPKDQSVNWIWNESKESALDTARFNEWFSNLFNLYANDTADPAAHVKDFNGAAPWLKVAMKPGEKPEKLEIFLRPLPDKKTVLLKTLPDGLVYEMPEAQLDSLLKKNKDFFLKPKSAS